MPTIKLKRSTTPSNVPSSLVSGEIAINEADGLLFWNDGGTVRSYSLHNKPRVSAAAIGDITPDTEAYDVYVRSALSAAIAINAPTGSPSQGQKLIFRFKDDGTSRALNWNAIYRNIGVLLPSATTVSKTTYVGAIYNSTDTKWDVVAVNTES